MLTQAELMAVLDYDKETGVFTWKARPVTENSREHARKFNGRFAGKPAGSCHRTGDGRVYRAIKIEQKAYLAHRLAWLYVHGVWPNGEIDHIDNDASNNRIANLRDITSAENKQNRTAPARKSRSGRLGVLYIRATGKWQAKITINGEVKYLGTFADREEAYAAYLTAKRELHPFGELAKQAQLLGAK